MTSFKKFILYRIPQIALTFVGLSILIFVLVRMVPNDPVRAAVGTGASEEVYDAYREELRIEEPLPVQYYYFVQDLLSGSLGQSIRTNNDVMVDIVQKLPATLELIMVGFTMAIILGVPLGVTAGIYQNKWPDHLSRFIALSGIGFPRFWLAILFQVVFVSWFALFPLTGRISGPAPAHVTGFYTIDSLLMGDIGLFMDAAWHLVLPATALGWSTMAQITRLVRSEMIEVSREDYIMTSRSYGIPSWMIAFKYMLKNAFSSTLTVLGFRIGGMISGATFVELIYSIDGVGRYALEAILALDYNAIVGVVLVLGITYMISNATVDVLYGYLDPRIRQEG